VLGLDRNAFLVGGRFTNTDVLAGSTLRTRKRILPTQEARGDPAFDGSPGCSQARGLEVLYTTFTL